ncbi:MAG: prolyl oligopeptidase family serine peptidase [Anaerolineales bacterium]|nr:prolyl oligopeptidase family serine peptidase [Anaerolineales bacterium]
MKKTLRLSLAALLFGGPITYLGIGYIIYNALSQVQAGCPTHAGNTPASFRIRQSGYESFDTTPYAMPSYEAVSFPSRQAGINLVGWYVEADPAAPAVILTHGLGACKHEHNMLLAAGMLHRNGFNVLLFDLRDQGFSTIEDGRTAIGNEEYLDLLGAWDWLRERKGIAPERIGLYGTSLGAATTLIAFAEEPRIAAAFVDSPYADLPTVIAEELARNNYPTFLIPGGLLMARLVAGDDLIAHSPADAVRRAAGRPLFIVHGDADTRIDLHHTRDLMALAEETGADLTVWLPAGVGHVEGAIMLPDEYEQRLVEFFRNALK